MNKNISTQRITYWAIMLALFCVLGMFSIQFGDSLKVSLQLFVVFLIGMISTSILDSFIITTCYLLLGLFLPVFAGFSSGVTPTFGFVIGFIPASIIITLIKKLFYHNENKIVKISGLVVALFTSTIIVYIFGASFMFFYFQGIGKAKDILTIISAFIVPYIPFDIIKMVLSISVFLVLEKPLSILMKKN